MDQQQIGIVIGIVAFAAIVLKRRIDGKRKRKLIGEKLAANPRIVDVRTPSEFGAGHFPGAINIPLDKISKRMKKLGSRDSNIIVYCATGSRSRVAVSHLRSAGFTDVLNAGPLSNLPR